MSLKDVASAKQDVRERVWRTLTDAGAARFPGAPGRIPNFTGAEQAAQRLAATEPWIASRVLKSNPDLPQLPVRASALRDRKRVYMAVPRLTTDNPFLLLDPDRIGVTARSAASIKGAARYGRATAARDVERVDLVVCGSVAVDRRGARVGKGGGYSDLELAILTELGLIDEDTTIATTVHTLQVVDGPLPETTHDFRVDIVVTPDEVVVCRRHVRPPGIIWEHLSEEKVHAIPVLRRLRERNRTNR